jgi:SNF2 family DNA or RNA helicase
MSYSENFLDLSKDGSLVIHCSFEEKDIAKSVGARWDKPSKVWVAAFTVKNIEFLVENLSNVVISDVVASRLEGEVEVDSKLQRLRGMAKRDTPIKLRIPGVKISLYNYQKLGVLYATAGMPGLLLGDEMGLGKTLQAIATACWRRENQGARHCLIVTPASLKWNWPLEIEKFTDAKYVVIDGTAEERIRQWLRDDVFFHVVNYELVLEDLFGGREIGLSDEDSAAVILRKEKQISAAKHRMQVLAPVRERLWDMIALDEAHGVKNHASKRTRNVKRLKAKFRMALSGTPMDGKLEDLHSIMEWVAPGLFEPRTRFLQKHAEFDFWGRVVRYRSIDEVKKKIEPYFLRRLKKDVLKDLPDKVYKDRYLTLSAKEMKTYKSLADCGHEATQDAQAMTAIIRCKQFCDWPALVGENYEGEKMSALREILQEVVIDSGHKAILFSQYSSVCEVLCKVVKEMKLSYLYICGDTPKKSRAAMQADFNNDSSINLMIGTDAMSTGLNFTSADYVINYDDAWSPAIMKQREDRAHRIGQKNVVTVINFICRDTIEERIKNVLEIKGAISSQTLGDETPDQIVSRLGVQDIAKLL